MFAKGWKQKLIVSLIYILIQGCIISLLIYNIGIDIVSKLSGTLVIEGFILIFLIDYILYGNN